MPHEEKDPRRKPVLYGAGDKPGEDPGAGKPGEGPGAGKPGGDQAPRMETREEILRRSGRYGGIGATFVASILVCVGGGYWLDRRLGTTPWLTLLGAVSGIGVGFYLFFKTVSKDDHLGEWFE